MDDVATQAGITRLIVYRHFSSKESLYRAVLVEVADRLRDRFLAGMHERSQSPRGWIFGSVLSVARENPDGFRLLTVHAAREPAFASHHQSWWEQAVNAADVLIASTISDPVAKAWATRTIVAYLVGAVLAWLETGSPDRDSQFVEQATDGLMAMYLTWAEPGATTRVDAPSAQAPITSGRP